MKDLKKDILSQIREEKIEPISKNIFVMKKIFVYIFLLLSILIGAVSFAIILGYLLDADWILTHKLGLIKVIGSFLPVFWFVFLLLSIAIGYGEYKKTARGYKYYFWQIVLGNVCLSLVLGAILYTSGISQIIENRIQNTLPQYREIFVGDRESRMIELWQNEEEGLLVGEVLMPLITNEGLTILQDSNKKTWDIVISGKTIIKHNLELKAGEKIKLIGTKTDENSFEAIEIRPYMGKSMMGKY